MAMKLSEIRICAVLLSVLLVLSGCGTLGQIPSSPDEGISSGTTWPAGAGGDEQSIDTQFPQSALLTSSAASQEDQAIQATPSQELRGIWISYTNLQIKGLDQNGTKARMDEIMANAKNFGFNAVFLQVRPYADAIYPSDYFPWSDLVTGEQGKDPGFDPLAIAVESARANGLAIHAWINPYRIQVNIEGGTQPPALASEGPYNQWVQDGLVVELPSGRYFNPAMDGVKQLIANGAAEIVQKYGVDGIHFDDYFYPDDFGESDAAQYEAYQQGGGDLSRDDWRRQQVNDMVKLVHDTVKAAKSDCLFGISPAGNIDNNYAAKFVDAAKWGSEEGYVDYLCPQLYYGFQNSSMPFEQMADQWSKLVTSPNVKLYIGLAAYKTGEEDIYAKEGKEEWQQNSDILCREIEASRQLAGYGGMILFHYDAVFDPAPGEIRKQEMESVKALFAQQ